MQAPNLNGPQDLPLNPRGGPELHPRVAGGVYLAAFAMLAGAVLQWRTSQTHVEEFSKGAEEQRHFNERLIESLVEIACRADLGATEDLSPVRFRLREADGSSIPRAVPFASLERLQTAQSSSPSMPPLSIHDGVLEFGLQIPGEYVLRLETAEQMKLAYKFRVHPQAPIDRCVICAGNLDISLSEADFVATLGSGPHLANGLALLHVAPAPFISGEWTWTPPADLPTKWIAASTSTQRLSAELLSGWDAGRIRDEIAATESLPDRLETSVPYRYFEVRQVICFDFPSNRTGAALPRLLGSIEFGSSDGSRVDLQRQISCEILPPQFEAQLTLLNVLKIPAPEGCSSWRELSRLQSPPSLRRGSGIPHGEEGTTGCTQAF